MTDNSADDTTQKVVDWQKLDELPDEKLRMLVASLLSVLQDSTEQDSDDSMEDVATIPPGPLRRQLKEALAENGVAASDSQINQIMESRPFAILLLQQIAQQPDLACEVEQAYKERQRMLVVDGGIILAGAVLVLVIKLKRIRANKKGVDVEFSDLKADVLAQVRAFLGL